MLLMNCTVLGVLVLKNQILVFQDQAHILQTNFSEFKESYNKYIFFFFLNHLKAYG